MSKPSRPKQAKMVRLETNFAGIKAGAMLFVATPEIIQNYIKDIPSGEFRTVHRMRNELARKHKCDATCPVSTAIFIRKIAENALFELHNGKSAEQITPFWRVLEPDSKIVKKLALDTAWLSHMQMLEGIELSN